MEWWVAVAVAFVGGGLLTGLAAVWQALIAARKEPAQQQLVYAQAAAEEAGILDPLRTEIGRLREDLRREREQRMADARFWTEQVARLESRVQFLESWLSANGMEIPTNGTNK